jgi:hypothetical protein
MCNCSNCTRAIKAVKEKFSEPLTAEQAAIWNAAILASAMAYRTMHPYKADERMLELQYKIEDAL